jgi:hypothetical protein
LASSARLSRFFSNNSQINSVAASTSISCASRQRPSREAVSPS